MNPDAQKIIIKLGESFFSFIDTKKKSQDIADLLMNLADHFDAPSEECDLLVEFSLFANPDEEEGLGAKTLGELKKDFESYRLKIK